MLGFGVDCLYGDHVGTCIIAFAQALSIAAPPKTWCRERMMRSPYVKLSGGTQPNPRWNIIRWLVMHNYSG